MDFANLGNTGVIGLQWGDEGKGKIVDLLTSHFDVVVRYAGGANAGHTVRIGDEKFALHLIPSGILRPNVICIIGPGVALDLQMLVHEIEGLRARGVKIGENLLISHHAHLVMPYHIKQDQLAEARLGAGRKIGTTARGIGPCYADKMLRSSALRVADLQQPDVFRRKTAEIVADRNKVFASLYGERDAMDAVRIADECLASAVKVAQHFTDTTRVLSQALSRKARILFEGAQGSLLDINHGTYPYVTSSACMAGGIAEGAGVPPSAIRSYVGVIKAYSTRVGEGPFPTELKDATGDRIRERGHEYGTTTGRPRRCGWFDAVSTKYSVDLCGATQLAMMHLDTLGSFEEVRICTAYRHRGSVVDFFPADVEVLNEVEPVYETLPGWTGKLGEVNSFEQLPAEARKYVERVEQLLGVPITLISIGADRMATIQRMAR